MTIQWTLVATFLYSEIAFIVLLLVPFISPRVWAKIFKSRFCQYFASKANVYFTIFIAILVLFFLDSVREMQKYSGGLDHEHHGGNHLDAEIQLSMKLFRSQRNYYIAGFALFLWLVIRRLIILILTQATLIAETEASMVQAQSATDRAESLLKEKELVERSAKEEAENFGNAQKESLEMELAVLDEKFAKAQKELDHAKSNLSVMTKQALAVSKEYDALLKKYSELQEELDTQSGKKVEKKDE